MDVHYHNGATEIEYEHYLDRPHRDDHYLLLIALQANFKISLDFETVLLDKPVIGLIVPGQVHHLIQTGHHEVYVVGFTQELMPPQLKPVIDSYFLQKKTLDYNKALFAKTCNIVSLMNQQTESNKDLSVFTLHALLHSLLGTIADSITTILDTDKPSGRNQQIVWQFTQLLLQHFAHWKKPAEYAAALHISTGHLNDTIKEVTGFSVSHHIQTQIVLEAKRKLYYTSLSVKEIAFNLGYEDTVYFGRLFKKLTNDSPVSFRNKFRD